jgi:hypothetical protein
MPPDEHQTIASDADRQWIVADALIPGDTVTAGTGPLEVNRVDRHQNATGVNFVDVVYPRVTYTAEHRFSIVIPTESSGDVAP